MEGQGAPQNSFVSISLADSNPIGYAIFSTTSSEPEQRELVSVLAMRLGAVRGIRAVVLGGSHARGRAQPGSDIDLGILYSEVAPFPSRAFAN